MALAGTSAKALVSGDADRLCQVLINLISNAVMRAGRLRPRDAAALPATAA